MRTYPLVSICIPVYNAERYLSQAIESALVQTYPVTEIVIIDNHSSDSSYNIALAYKYKYAEKIWVTRTPENRGPVVSHNACIAAASGEFIKFLHADDVLLPNCVERMVDAMAKKDIKLVACARIRTNEDLVPERTVQWYGTDVTINGRDAIGHCLFYGNKIGEATAVMFRRSHAPVFGSVSKYTYDLNAWCEILSDGGNLAYISSALVLYRKHGQYKFYAKDIRNMVLDDLKLAKHYTDIKIANPTYKNRMRLWQRCASIYLVYKLGLWRFL